MAAPSPISSSHAAVDAGVASPVLGVRVGVVGAGDLLTQTISQLHRLGAQCVILEDPYHAVAELARTADSTYGALVLILPCIYPGELACIPIFRNLAPHTRILIAAADQHLSSLASALRLGASGVVTDLGVELLGPTSHSLPTAAGSPLATTAPAVVSSATPAMAVAGPAVTDEEPTAPSSETATETEAEAQVDESEEDLEFDDEVEGDLPQDNGDPLLTADELHALLHDDGGRA